MNGPTDRPAATLSEQERASERYAQLIVDSIPGFIAVFTPAGEVEHVNRQVLDYFGKTLDDLKNWQFGDAAHPDDLPRVIAAFTQSLSSGEPFDFALRARRYDGTYRWFRSRGSALRDDTGAIVRWYNVLIDIDERMRAEDALKAREEELRRAQYHATAAQSLSQTGSFLADPAADEHTWSEELYRICELEVGSRISFARFRALVHPDDMPVFDAALERGFAGEGFDVTLRIVTASGVTKHLHAVSKIVDKDAVRPTVVGAIQDVTKSKLAEETLSARLADLRRANDFLNEGQRLSRTGSFITDLIAEEHHWSNELFSMFELDPATKVSVQVVRDRVQAEDLPAFDAGIQRSRAGEDFDLVFRIQTPQGRQKFLHAVARVVERVEGRPLFVGAIQDVTERKLADHALQKARTELAHVSRALTLGTLTASVAHEVNQPLSGIITNASTCLKMLNARPPNVAGAVSTVQRLLRDGNRAADVIQRLRTLFSRAQPKSETVDLKDAALEVLALVASELERFNVSVRTDFGAGRETVIGDRVELQQVILNLIMNAVEAMKEVVDHRRDLLVATEREGDGIRLSVRDSGVGIEAGSLDKLFDAFYTTKAHGMGIGLSISRSIVESHGGRLWAQSNEGPGATFSFVIPCDPGVSSITGRSRANLAG